MKIINSAPTRIKVLNVNAEEYFSYTYLPVKVPNSTEIILEPRLNIIREMIGVACCDFVSFRGLQAFAESFVYVTTKHAFQRAGKGYNRQGWHTDGFGTDDVNYIWSNKQPTIFNTGCYEVSEGDKESMSDFERLIDPKLNYTFPNNTLLRLTDLVVHKVAEIEEGNRCFVKISFSKDKYDLKGNSINYNLGLNWVYRDRGLERNTPQER